MSAFHLRIKGKVQGVFFRATAKKKANEFNVTGWIKNTKDGDVEAIISGDQLSLQNFINWCKKGPDAAAVEEVLTRETDDITFETFTILK